MHKMRKTKIHSKGLGIVMSMARCNRCDSIVDTDEGDCYPNAYKQDCPVHLQDECVCENCQEEIWDIQQEQLMEDAA
jgi:hypothetical protein